MRSLRARLFVGTSASVVALLLALSLAGYLGVRHLLWNAFDASLATTAHALAASVEADGPEVDFDAQKLMAWETTAGRLAFELSRQDGTPLRRFSGLGDAELPRFHGQAGEPAFRHLEARGEPLRVAGMLFVPDEEGADQVVGPASPGRGGEPLLLVVAKDASSVVAQLRLFAGFLLAAALATIAAVLLLTRASVGRGLAPLEALGARIGAIGEADLAARIPEGPLPEELAPVASGLNGLLERLEKAFERERAFTADVAHELRTPLAGLRSTLEVAVSRQREGPEYEEALRDALGIVGQMHPLVENLLMLARLDAGHLPVWREPVALARLVASCWRPLAERAAARGLTFENQLPASLVCSSDPGCLATVVTNLLDNAVEYAEAGGRVWVSAEGAAGLVVANTGCRLRPGEAQRAFDRFWRADPSRRHTGVHCGLGLSLVRRIVGALGGNASVSAEHGVFAVRLTF